MGRREIFNTFLLLVEIEGHLTHEFVTYIYETQDWAFTTSIPICYSLFRYFNAAIRYHYYATFFNFAICFLLFAIATSFNQCDGLFIS
jgi:hypothetical protein